MASQVTYTVKSGDTLSEIAATYFSTYGAANGCSTQSAYMNYIAEASSVKNVNIIYVGQTLIISGSASSSSSANTSQTQPKVTKVGLVSDQKRRIYAEWEFDNANTDYYLIQWWEGYLIDGEVKGTPDSDEGTKVTQKWDTFDAPTDVVRVNVRVKPVSKTYENNKGDTVSYFTGKWSTMDSTTVYNFTTYATIGVPSAPDVTIEDYTLTAEVDNIPDNVTYVQFQIVKDHSEDTYKDSKKKVTSNYASYACKIELGHSYKARCRYINTNGSGEWSDWSNNETTPPSAPSGINVCRADDETTAYLEWDAVTNADSYDIEYANNIADFDGSNQTTVESGVEYTHYRLGGLTTGKEYFFRIRAVNTAGHSEWTASKSVILGTEPAAPTTWSSTTTVVTGEPLTLFWVHNSEDSSTQTKFNIEFNIDGVISYIEQDTSEEDDDEKTMFYAVDTSGYSEGVTILWRVQTAGATKVYGEWSIERTIDIYAPPTMSINMFDSEDNSISELTRFPLRLKGESGPKTQTPTGYHLSIKSGSYYETVDDVGHRKIVNAGETIYSKYIDSSSYDLLMDLSAGDIDLENNVTYIVDAVVSMNSGLTGEDSRDFTVAWTDEVYEPNAELAISQEDITALIKPYCKDTDGELIPDVSLSVYRREFDGSFTELMTGLDNMKGTFITDPHPSLDYARYRIVAISNATGAVSYYDMPGYPVGEKAVVIQWDEDWSTFEPINDNVIVDQTWSGSILKLPYNIDVSEENQSDVSLIEYIGRKHPVSYYGTQIGQTASWSIEIPKSDKETVYALRRLAIWMGDVYVREPSGTGYWANISVSFSQKHLATTIPVKLSITRVAGGV